MAKIVKVPIMLQMETSECGAACLGMVLAYYGRRLPLEHLRLECGVSSAGSSMSTLKSAAVRSGMEARVYRMGMESVRTVKVPAILHWNMAHFVVLCGFDKKGAVIADPACGKIHVPYHEFSRAFTGIVLTLTPGDAFQKEKRKAGADFISSHSKRFLPALAATALAGIILSCIQFLIPLLDTAFIDHILIDGKTTQLPLLLLLLSCCGFFTALSSAVGASLHDVVERRLSLCLNSDFMRRICDLPISFFAQRSPGELTDRQSGNLQIVDNICRIITAVLVNVLVSLCYLIGFFLFDVRIGLIGLAAAIANIVMLVTFSARIEQSAIVYRRNSGILRGGVSSAVDMIETIKSCSCQQSVFENLAGAGAKSYALCKKMEQTGGDFSAFFSFISQFINAIILAVGVSDVISGNYTVGLLVALIALMTAFLSPLGNVTRMSVSMRSFKGNIDAANDVIRYTQEQTFLKEITRQTQEIDGMIQVQNLSFRYGLYTQLVVEGVSFETVQGSSIAFVGESGCGKSTIVKIVAGLYAHFAGQVLYSGSERNQFAKEYFYSKVAVVDQNISLFSGTVLENITLFDDSISYEDAVTAARLACIHNEILMREKGYMSHVEERGKNFSGGQRQRIEIARALAKKPNILILDEATSALDTMVEYEIMKNIKKQNITLIIAAHRLSTIRDCDEIVVMEKGRVCERGTHEKLMQMQGLYHGLVEGVDN